MPVGEGDRVVGMITNRDIAACAVAEGEGLDTTVREVMTPTVKYCFEDVELDRLARNWANSR